MKRLVVLLIAVVCLSGCSVAGDEIGRAMELRSRILKAEQCTFEADITADYGDKLYSFSMSCQCGSDGALRFSVEEPQTIAGIGGAFAEKGGALTFDDTALQFAAMADDQVTPVSAPWILMKALRGGYLTSAGMEGELLRLSIDDSYEEDALHVDVWLNAEEIPVRAEILYDGRRILSLEVENFQIL